MSEDTKNCVICYAHPKPHLDWREVLLIEKRRPAWQAGRFNLPGGRIQVGETPEQAARRELYEEAEIDCDLADVKVTGLIACGGYTIYAARCDFESRYGRNVPKSVTSERVFWLPLDEALDHPKLIPNLRIIIPLMRSGLSYWSLSEVPSKGELPTHLIKHCLPKVKCEHQST